MFEKVDEKYSWENLIDFVKESLKNDRTGHDFDHLMRVWKNVLLISSDLDVDFNVLLASVLLHDISFKDGPLKSHHKLSAGLSNSILPNYGFEEDLIKEVHHVIINHVRSFEPYNSLSDLSLEAKVLYDADTLDALGAIGILRMISFSLNQEIPYYISENDKVDTSFYGNIKFIKTMRDNLILEKSKQLADERMHIVDDFLKQLKLEVS